MNETIVNTTNQGSIQENTLENEQINQQVEVDVASLDDIHNDIIAMNNSLVTIGTGIIFIISLLIGITAGKVLKIWN